MDTPFKNRNETEKKVYNTASRSAGPKRKALDV